MRLFAERAAAAVPGFTVDDENAPAIAQIARRLDGLPLAIELAAARVKLLPPEAILPRLEHSLGLLTGGSRDLPDRQQTLRATIAWSYDLLTEGARRLLATCSVFAGGASLEVIETVCGARWTSACRCWMACRSWSTRACCGRCARPGPARYAMLETIREYAAERLEAMPEADRVRSAHAAAFLALVEADGRPHAGLARKEWLERVDTRAQQHPRGARLVPRSMIRPPRCGWPPRCPRSGPCAATTPKAGSGWANCSAWSPTPSMARVSALNGAAWLAIDQGDYADADGMLGESIELSRALGDTVGEAIATVYLGRCKMSSRQIAAGSTGR